MRSHKSDAKRPSLLLNIAGATLLSATICAVASAQSRSLPAPAYATAAPAEGKVVVEEHYPFTVKRYSPAVEVKPVSRESASYDTPEAAAVSGISAMFAKDFGWFRSTWDQASNALMDERDKAMKRGPEFWMAAWEKAFKNRKALLTERVETGDYVFILYKLVDEAKRAVAGDAPNQDIELITVLKLQDGKWLATQEMAQDPVLLYWKRPEVKLKRVMRGGQQDRIVVQP